MPREATLARLLMELFNDDELRVHLAAEPGGPDLCAGLPGRPVALTVFSAEAVAALVRRGEISVAFFDRLATARPQRADEVRKVRDLWPDPAVPVMDALNVRYRQALAAACGRPRIVGMPTGGPGVAAQTGLLFIPLHLKRKRWHYTTDALLQALTDRPAASPCRIVILGDPGSGKTTLCRYLAATIASRTAAAAPLPFYLPLREYVAALARAPLSIPEFLRQNARERLSVALREDDVTCALTSGGAILLIDGIDEVGDATRRGEINERVIALAAAYPDVALVVTSRIAGYDDAPLPRTGPASFTRYFIDPFTDDDLQAFVRRWYVLQTPNDPDRRERDIHGLLAALAAAPAVGALARNPLLATLIALIYRAEACLPADRPQLYERCLQLLLESWPESRGQRLPELDVDVQRGCLEDLAWHMLERTTDASAGLTLIDRRVLVDHITASLVAGGPHAQRRLAERWIGWIERETGVLVEQTPGSFGFLHRSLGEYLAACHLERHGDAASRIAWILAHALDARWTEVALLYLGRRPEDAATLDAVLTSLQSSSAGRTFLLMCAREGVDFDAEQLDPLVAACVAEADSRALDTLGVIVRCATRHAPVITAWFLRALANVPLPHLAPLLRLAARLGLAPADIDAALRRHPEAATVRALALRLLPLVRGAGDTALNALAGQLWRTVEPAVAVAALADNLPDAGDLAAAAVGRVADQLCQSTRRPFAPVRSNHCSVTPATTSHATPKPRRGSSSTTSRMSPSAPGSATATPAAGTPGTARMATHGSSSSRPTPTIRMMTTMMMRWTSATTPQRRSSSSTFTRASAPCAWTWSNSASSRPPTLRRGRTYSPPITWARSTSASCCAAYLRSTPPRPESRPRRSSAMNRGATGTPDSDRRTHGSGTIGRASTPPCTPLPARRSWPSTSPWAGCSRPPLTAGPRPPAGSNFPEGQPRITRGRASSGI